jgi:gamma-glutamyltranspeptidase/glutathione hydrolase
VNIPGALDGWLRLHRLFGRLPFEDLLAPAIAAAETGFTINAELEAELAETPWDPGAGPLTEVNDESRRLPWKRPLLAGLLRRIAGEGRAALYDGEIAADIVASTDGLITKEDLLIEQASVEAPLNAPGREVSLVVPGAPTQGAVLAQSFRLVEQLDGWMADDPGEALHLMIGSYRAVAENAVATALSSAAEPPAGTVDTIDRRFPAYRSPLVGVLGGTAFLATADGNGCLVSMAQSNYHRMGSGKVIRSAGLPLNNRGGGFNLEPGHVNELAPNRRPFHTLVPAIVNRASGARSAIGTRGGLLQPQILLQLLLWSLRHKDNPDTQLARARLNIRPEVATSLVLVESSLPSEIAGDLTLRGHRIVTRAVMERSWGPAFALTMSADGAVAAGVDPRSEGKGWVG